MIPRTSVFFDFINDTWPNCSFQEEIIRDANGGQSECTANAFNFYILISTNLVSFTDWLLPLECLNAFNMKSNLRDTKNLGF